MQRYVLTDYETASPEVRAIFDDYMRTTQDTKVPVWLRSLGHSAALTKAYWERAKGTLFSGSLSLPLKEMIVFMVSARHGARYCTACHARNVLSLDKLLSFDDLQKFLEPNDMHQLPPYYKQVAEFVDKVVTNPNCVEDEDFETLMDDGFSREEICEIIAVIDLASMFNVYTGALKLDLDPEYRAII